MSKKLQFNKPNKNKTSDEWIQEGSNKPIVKEEAKEQKQRLTFDIPKSWHTKIKIRCAEKGTKMTDEILPLLQKHFNL